MNRKRYFREYYKRNPNKVKQWHLKDVIKKQTIINKLKDKPCDDCGFKFHPVAMDFDHRPGTHKVRSIGMLIRSASLKRAVAESKKCDIVCANCHRVRTWRRLHESKR